METLMKKYLMLFPFQQSDLHFFHPSFIVDKGKEVVYFDQNCDMRDVLWLIRREGRQKQKILLPAMETTPEFKEKIEQTCRSAGLPYSAVVLHLLRIWMNQEIRPDTEPYPEFVASAARLSDQKVSSNRSGGLLRSSIPPESLADSKSTH